LKSGGAFQQFDALVDRGNPAAYNRISHHPRSSVGMMIVAVLGLLVNLAAAAILLRGIAIANMRGAFLHVISDHRIGGSDCRWGNHAGDRMVSGGYFINVFIGVLILFSSWTLVKESLSVLMQAVPKGIRLDVVRETIESVDGVSKVHDLHIWAVTSDLFTLSAHAVVENGGDFHEVLNGIEHTLKERFNIEHTTIQLETESREDKEFKAF
jgi:cobalt-zinc-cadmium efflux system protein